MYDFKWLRFLIMAILHSAKSEQGLEDGEIKV